METKVLLRRLPMVLLPTRTSQKLLPSHTIRLIPRTVPQLREDVQTEKLIQ